MKMTFRQLRDKLRNLEAEQLNATLSCFSKYWVDPEENMDLCFDPQTGEPYFYVTTDKELKENS